jgi:hypothetical protein
MFLVVQVVRSLRRLLKVYRLIVFLALTKTEIHSERSESRRESGRMESPPAQRNPLRRAGPPEREAGWEEFKEQAS